MTGDVNDVMLGSAENFGDLKKSSELRLKLRTWELIFGARRGKTSWGLRNVPHVVGSDWKVSIERKLCLSLLISKNLILKKVNKSFVPEPKESR